MKNLLLILSVCIGMQASAAWIQRASLGNEGRHRASAIGLSNFGYVGLGHYNGFGSEYYFNDWWQYDPASNSWSQKADYPGFFGQGNCGCHSWTFEGKIYVGLGENQPAGLYRYDPLTNTWQQMTSAPAGTVFQDTHEMVINNKAYFMNLTGGAGLYEYDCGSDSWSNIGTVNIPL